MENTLPLRVLLVEDSSLFRDRVAESIESPGRVKIIGCAISEKAALDMLWVQEWDVLILDLQLKQGNGLGILKALQAKGRRPDTKVIVLTNHDYYLYRLKTTECGVSSALAASSDFLGFTKDHCLNTNGTEFPPFNQRSATSSTPESPC